LINYDLSIIGGDKLKNKASYNQVKKYMENEASAYQAWFRAMEEENGDLVGGPFSLKELKEKFSNWLATKEDEVYNLICTKWKYCEKKQKYHDPVMLAAALGDFSIQAAAGWPSPFAVAALLVLLVLDNYCKCKDKPKNC
jgi:hypothetical protein